MPLKTCGLSLCAYIAQQVSSASWFEKRCAPLQPCVFMCALHRSSSGATARPALQLSCGQPSIAPKLSPVCADCTMHTTAGLGRDTSCICLLSIWAYKHLISHPPHLLSVHQRCSTGLPCTLLTPWIHTPHRFIDRTLGGIRGPDKWSIQLATQQPHINYSDHRC